MSFFSGASNPGISFKGLFATLFTDLLDVPSSYSGQGLKILRVNAGATALEFTTAGGVAWGAITGTLSSQTDLQSALDLKANLASPTFSGTVVLPAATVTLAMMANMATSSLIYRRTASSGVPEVNTLAQLKTDLALVSSDVGLGNVTNTSDANKPVSTAQQTALDLKANLAGPTFTGTVTFPSGQALVAPVLGTPTSGTLTNCTFPTLNQNTTGSAAKLSISGQTGTLTFSGLTSTARNKVLGDTADTILELGGSYTPTGTWTSLTMVTPVLGTPTSGTMTNVSGTAANLTAGNVTTVTMTNTKAIRLDGNWGIAWAKYSFATNGGSVSTITPGAAVNTTIPANAVLVGGTVNVTTACTSGGSATLAIGCAGTGGATTTLLAATAVASLTTNALFTTVSTFAAPKKLTGAGGITFTIATAALTAGIVEVFVTYFLAAA